MLGEGAEGKGRQGGSNALCFEVGKIIIEIADILKECTKHQALS